MSAVVKTITPFISQEILLKALDSLQVLYQITNDGIVLTEHTDYQGNWRLILENGKYVIRHDSDSLHRWSWYNTKNVSKYNSVNEFLQAVEKEYLRIEKEIMLELERKRMEEELKRMEEERKAFVEKQKEEVLKKAKEQGYSYQIKQVGNSVKIILTKNTY
ncbi:MAG: hypothetical protein OHK0038_26950 [Flammeovirgaceae bacterium]